MEQGASIRRRRRPIPAHGSCRSQARSFQFAGSAVAPRPGRRPLSVELRQFGAGPALAKVTESGSTSPAKTIRFFRPDERLPKGLPDWFKARDADGDGQISMAEFRADWPPAKEAEFLHLDLNHDGVITPDECLKVEKSSGSKK